MTTAAHQRPFTRLRTEVSACVACPRMSHTHLLSTANGPLDARVLFVAEAPGRLGAAVTGVPLSGDEAGRRFEAFLALAGLARSEIFVTNAALCNPLDALGNNRAPSAREVAHCRPFLGRTLDLVNAPIVVALGRVALETLRLLAPHPAVLSRHVATPHPWRNRLLVPMYHSGRQSTIHRPHPAQEEDWRRLGRMISPCKSGR